MWLGRRGWDGDSQNGIASLLRRIFKRPLLKYDGNGGQVVTSTVLAERMSRYLPPARIFFVPLAVDVEQFQPPEDPEVREGPPGPVCSWGTGSGISRPSAG